MAFGEVFCVCQRSRKEAGVHVWKEASGASEGARLSLYQLSFQATIPILIARTHCHRDVCILLNDLTIMLRSYQSSTLTLGTKLQCVP